MGSFIFYYFYSYSLLFSYYSEEQESVILHIL